MCRRLAGVANRTAAADDTESARSGDAPVVRALFTVHNSMMRIGDRLTAPLGLTSARWMLLCALGRCSDASDGCATITDLAAEQMQSVQAISSMLATMEREGLIVRERRRGMGRTVFARLTDRGRGALAAVDALGERFMQPFLAGFSPEEVQRLDADLRRLVANLEAYERELLAESGRGGSGGGVTGSESHGQTGHETHEADRALKDASTPPRTERGQ